MDKKLNVLVIVTSAPHFPVDIAKQSYRKCLDFLRSNLGHRYNFMEYGEVVTDTVSMESDMEKLRKQGPDILVLLQGAFTWDNITLYLNQYFAKIPVILWAIPEGIFLDNLLCTNSLCGMIMNNSALHKTGNNCLYCFVNLLDDKAYRKIGSALAVAACAVRIKRARYGMVGYRPTGFYNSTFDEMNVRRVLGIEAVYYDLANLFSDIEHISEEEIEKDMVTARSLGVMGEATDESLRTSSRVYLALREFIHREKIDFLAVQCWPEMMKRGLNPCLVLGRLIDENVASGCESDFGGALSMAIASWISGEPSWLADLVDINEKNRSFYFWHCGAAPVSLADGSSSQIINKQFRGLDRGNTLEFVLEKGNVTVLRFGITNGKYRIFAFEGEAISPDIKIRGNFSEIIPQKDPGYILEQIIENGIEHHFAIIYGSYLRELKSLSKIMDIDFYYV